MITPRALREAAASLMLFAALFGGVLMGLSNMLLIASDPAASARLHGSQEAGSLELPGFELQCLGGQPAASAGRAVPPLPAHCLFCLDGIAPQPLTVATHGDATALRHVVAAVTRTRPVHITARFESARPRDPPRLVI